MSLLGYFNIISISRTRIPLTWECPHPNPGWQTPTPTGSRRDGKLGKGGGSDPCWEAPTWVSPSIPGQIPQSGLGVEAGLEGSCPGIQPGPGPARFGRGLGGSFMCDTSDCYDTCECKFSSTRSCEV